MPGWWRGKNRVPLTLWASCLPLTLSLSFSPRPHHSTVVISPQTLPCGLGGIL